MTRGTGKYSELLTVDDNDWNRDFKQAGISDRTILCESCERRFTPYDTHGFNVITEMMKAKLEYRDSSGKVAYIATTADYTLFKLFVLSILWRASVSSLEFFAGIKLGVHEERVRAMLETNNAESENDYPILCFYQTGHKYPSTVLQPFRQRTNDGINFCRLYLQYNIVFVIKVDSRPLCNELLPWAVKPLSQVLFAHFPYLRSYEMEALESTKIRIKKHLGLPLRVTYISGKASTY
ncbi:MAG TPA: hypothetical protein VGO67_14525 [Verrucomicrobiae bacterium]|jgi:hypothetical protein